MKGTLFTICKVVTKRALESDKLELVIYKRGFESLRFSLMMKGIG